VNSPLTRMNLAFLMFLNLFQLCSGFVAAVPIACHNFLVDRPEEAVLLLKSALILGQEPLEVMEQHPGKDSPLGMPRAVDSRHIGEEEAKNGPPSPARPKEQIGLRFRAKEPLCASNLWRQPSLTMQKCWSRPFFIGEGRCAGAGLGIAGQSVKDQGAGHIYLYEDDGVTEFSSSQSKKELNLEWSGPLERRVIFHFKGMAKPKKITLITK
jgi:hypothetical protein